MKTRLKLLVLMSLLVSAPLPALARQEIPVYYASVLAAKGRQDAIKDSLGKAGAEPTVFGKFKDFSDALKSKGPGYVIAPSFFQKFYPEYEPVLQFSDAGSRQFRYLVLSLSDKWSAKNLSQGKIGIVEEVDREHLKELVGDLLGAKFRMVKSVSKPEDLFPLLVFKSADFILISPENYRLLREKFTAKVYIVAESRPVDAVKVFRKKGQSPDEELQQRLASLSPESLKSLGFSKLEALQGEGKEK